ncbi:hypothetical protein GCM10011613_21820 [Cellvibrio zantedeschiae]|uniref:DUF1579 domain-containing protein n=1 Tax=Cellvibrio zantedeschiae TaxID=1237077 RepID=A0ABQ3B797_9GAMM|nr:DUF1579 family protein [Cellvibrio zantedeschiae]GGY76943.1 hypothetical protein GCM10011613_21820 [Cellvibrio zantedeschiae]
MTHPDSHPNAFKLSLFIGQWSGGGEVLPNPWGPAGACEGVWQFGFDKSGMNLLHDYRETRGDGFQFEAHGVFNIDPQTKEVIWFWFDSLGFPPLNPARGDWDTDTLILTKKTPRGIGRSTFIFKHKYFEYTIEAQVNGEKNFSTIMRGEFNKTPVR